LVHRCSDVIARPMSMQNELMFMSTQQGIRIRKPACHVLLL
jgi:hypothetical protein